MYSFEGTLRNGDNGDLIPEASSLPRNPAMPSPMPPATGLPSHCGN